MSGYFVRRAFVCLLGFLLFCATAANAQSPSWVYQSVGISITDNPDPGELTGFGSAVAIEGRTALVGIPFYSPDTFPGSGPGGQGRVAVFTADAATGTVWTRTGSIENPDSTTTRSFGQTLAIKQGRLIVGSSSAIFAFEKHGAGANEEWKLLATLTPPASTASGRSFGFGSAFAYDDGVLAVVVFESVTVNGVSEGTTSVYFYQVDRDGKARVLDKVASPGAGCGFGTSLALDADTLVVGCPGGPTPTASGLAYVYTHRGDRWKLTDTLAGSTAPAADFGSAVAIRKDVIVVGAPAEDMEEDSNFNFLAQGAGYVYLRKGKDCGDGTWTLSQRIRPDPNVSGTYGELGFTVAVDGEHAAFGAPLSTQTLEPAPGVTLIYQKQGSQFVFEGKAPGISDGTSMAMSEKRLIVGTDEDFEPFGLFEQATIVDFDPPVATTGSSTSP